MKSDNEPIVDMLRQYWILNARIREIFDKVLKDEWNGIGGFQVTRFRGSYNEDMVDIVYADKNGTAKVVQFPMEWLDPSINLLTVKKSEFKFTYC